MVRYNFSDRYQFAAEVLQDLRSLAKSAIGSDSRTSLRSNHHLVLPDGLSCGEKIIITSSVPRLKQRGVKEFADSNSEKAFNLFKESWQKEYGKVPVNYSTVAVAGLKCD